MTNLKWRNNHESFKHASTKPRENPPCVTQLPRLRILQRRLKHRIRPHPQRVLERQVRREWRQPLPQRPHALRAGHGGAAVDDPLVRAGPVQLQPRLDDVDGLQAARLHGSSDRARYGLHVGRDGPVGFLLVFLVGHCGAQLRGILGFVGMMKKKKKEKVGSCSLLLLCWDFSTSAFLRRWRSGSQKWSQQQNNDFLDLTESLLAQQIHTESCTDCSVGLLQILRQ